MSEEVLLLAAQAKAWTEIGVLHTAQNVKRLPLLLLQTIFTAEDTVKELIGRVFLGHRTKSQLSRAER